jgi:hypothetical protein
MDRQVRPCRFCGLSYKGRGLYADHGFAKYNLERHEDACVGQQVCRVEREKRTRVRNMRRNGVGPGQLGFPFDGVPEEVEDE